MSRGEAMQQARASRSAALRVMLVAAALFLGFGAITAQLLRLAWNSGPVTRLAVSAPVAESYSRPDILDRDGKPLARDILLPSIMANPSKILDIDEAIDRLTAVLPPADAARLPLNLENRERSFIWVARKVSTSLAQSIHDMGLPGIDYRWETKRTYPQGLLAGHVLGAVDGNSVGLSGLERHMDEAIGLRIARDEGGDPRPPLRTSLVLAAQFGLEEELADAISRTGARAAAGLVMDVRTGEIAAAASLPAVDPAFPEKWIAEGPIDHLTRGTYELGSVFKLVTAAMALELGLAEPDTPVDVGGEISIGRFRISGDGPQGAKVPLREVIFRSLNVGTANLALAAGSDQQRAFLAKLGLLAGIETEAGPVKSPLVPAAWDRAATITVSYGHGLAVAPLQFAAAAATLINGGYAVTPTFRPQPPLPDIIRKRVVSEATSAALREMLRETVTNPRGTARKAEAAGYRVGGKTGTADLPVKGRGYSGTGVVTSFVGAFPMDAPRHLVMVTLFEPEARGGATRLAGDTAAPAASRIVSRLAPILGVLPDAVASKADTPSRSAH